MVDTEKLDRRLNKFLNKNTVNFNELYPRTHYYSETEDLYFQSYQEFSNKLIEYAETKLLEEWHTASGELPKNTVTYSKKEQKRVCWIVQNLKKAKEKDIYQKIFLFLKRTLILPEGENFVNVYPEIYEKGQKLTCEFLKKGNNITGLTSKDMIQGSRTLWFEMALQFIFGHEIILTPSLFGYNMLYPLTDNYIDNPDITMDEKMTFSILFRQRLNGEKVKERNVYEGYIYKMVDEIESQWDRQTHPTVYHALVHIHDSQTESVKRLSLSENNEQHLSIDDILRLSARKGSASTIAAFCMVRGSLQSHHVAYIAHLGLALQLVDDLQDIEEDLKSQRLSIFTSTVLQNKKLDDITAHLINFIHMPAFISPFPKESYNSVSWYTQVYIVRMTWVLIIEAVSKLSHYFSDSFYESLKSTSPFPMKILRNENIEKQNYEWFLARNRLV